MRYIFMAALIALFATCVHAQEVYINGSVATKASFCIEVQDAYNLALSTDPKNDWAKMQEQGRCEATTIPWHFYRTLSEVNNLRVVELRIKLTDWHSVYAVWQGELAATLINWDSASPYKGWADKQDVTTRARLRFCQYSAGGARCSCCDGAEIVKTKFRINPDDSDGWQWLNPKTGKWANVPDDIIHWGEPTPDQQAVAFEYPVGSGVLRCFFPPQEGGI